MDRKLKVFAGYLPYDLKVYSGKSIAPACTIIQINTGNGNIGISEDLKPVLRPYSDIFHTIIHNGKEICPIIEMAKTQHPNRKWELREGSGGYAHNDGWYFSFIDGCFNFYYKFNSKIVMKQTQLFDYVHELKIDFRGLIDVGLAYSVYDLPENPYN